jgi:hypothetical protein
VSRHGFLEFAFLFLVEIGTCPQTIISFEVWNIEI